MPASRKRHAIVISHASATLAVAKQIEQSVAAAGLDPWRDDSAIRIGALLGRELQQAGPRNRFSRLNYPEARSVNNG